MEWIVVSRHAGDRWQQRTDSPGVGPVVAWNEATRVDIRGVHGDETRYHEPSETVLVRRCHTLVTVIDAEGAYRTTAEDLADVRRGSA